MSGPAQAVNLLRCLRRWKSFTGIQSCEMTRHGHGWRVQDPAAGSSLDSPSQQHVIPSLMSAVCCQGYSYHGHAAAWCNTPSQKLLWGERAWGRLRRGGGHHLHCTVPSLTPEVLEAALAGRVVTIRAATTLWVTWTVPAVCFRLSENQTCQDPKPLRLLKKWRDCTYEFWINSY